MVGYRGVPCASSPRNATAGSAELRSVALQEDPAAQQPRIARRRCSGTTGSPDTDPRLDELRALIDEVEARPGAATGTAACGCTGPALRRRPWS